FLRSLWGYVFRSLSGPVQNWFPSAASVPVPEFGPLAAMNVNQKIFVCVHFILTRYLQHKNIVTMSDSSFEVHENLLIGNKSHYLVERFIGKGTFGKVAKCKDLLTNKEVAIKFIKKNLEEDGEDEIKALIEVSKIDAERYNLVKFVEWFHYNGHFCIVFEMLDKSLYNIMRGRDFRPLSLKEIKAIARQLLVALKGLKKINMVHCDIKLDNIMLKDHASESFRLKLIDFGFAKKAEDLETGATIQNLIFRAPEVILGLPLDERVDLWDSEYNIIKAMFFTQFVENRRVVWKALRHPFFNLRKKQRKTTKPQEPATAEVYQQPKAKEVTSLPHGPAAIPQEKSNDTIKKSTVQEQKDDKREAPVVSRKRKRSDQQSQELRATQT
uniref:Protein kinase domain-containing protein n=1 Tax=Oryzias melastigma TaxID=30732 RepID=A0A3B3CDR2_ORYME